MAKLLGQVAVGSIVKLNENGSPTNYIVVNQGIPGNSPLYDASCNGTWLLRQDISYTATWGGNGTNYGTGSLKNNVSAFPNRYDPDIQAKVVNAIIPYCIGNGSETVNSGSNGVQVRGFLLSGYELGWTKDDYLGFPIDGNVLNYFSGASSQDSKRISNYNGTSTGWWTRSPYVGNGEECFNVTSTGFFESISAANYYYGVRPAVIFPQSMLVMDDGSLSASILPPP